MFADPVEAVPVLLQLHTAKATPVSSPGQGLEGWVPPPGRVFLLGY